MQPRYLIALIALSAVWAGGFLFNAVAVEEMSATTLVGLRMAIGAATLAPVVLLRVGPARVWEEVRTRWRHVVLVALLGSAAAPALTAWSQNRLESGTTAIISASSPLFVAVFSLAVARHDVVSGFRLVGLLTGFGGVALLVGAQPSGSVLSAGIVVVASAAFALASVLVGRWFAVVDPMVTTFVTTVTSAVLLSPLVVLDPPGGMGDWKVAGSVLGLGVAVTGTGFIVYYWIIAGAGASNGILAAYLIPAFALVYGAVLLDEPLTAAGIGGFAVIAIGVTLGTGAVGLRSRRARAEQGRRVLLEDVDEKRPGQSHDVEVVADDA